VPPPEAKSDRRYCYPELRITHNAETDAPPPGRSFARLSKPGLYVTTVTRPGMFADYLSEQIDLLVRDYGVAVETGISDQQIPFPYVLDGLDISALDGTPPTELARHFPATELAEIGDEIADGLFMANAEGHRPLALFDGLRTDFSLARLKHYTGSPAEHVQRYILFTNYHRYVDEFVDWACAELRREGAPYTALSGAGGVYVTRETADPARMIADSAWRKHLSPDRAQPQRDNACEYRCWAGQRQDDMRPSGGSAPGSLADDWPLRRPASQPADRGLCAGPCLSAR
jgi:AMP nucleosidase